MNAFSFFDPDYRRDPHPVLHRLRAEDPVHKSPFGWIVTRHEDVARLNRDPRLGRDMRKTQTGGIAAMAAGHEGLIELATSFMIHLDGADHARIRKLMAYAFTPKATAQMQTAVENVADRLLARLPERGEVDLMRDFARPLPVTVICDLMAVPVDDLPRFAHWSETIADHLEFPFTPEKMAAADRSYLEFKAYIESFVESRRRSGGDGLIDRLIAAERETEALTPNELYANIIGLLIAGHETTTNLIGNGMLALLQNPAQLARLRAQPELMVRAVEECLRYESPVNTNGRVALEELEVGGKLIKKGHALICMLGAANRDPAAFENPDQFDIARDPNPHQSFGGGAHHCIGAPLARLEGKIGIAALLRRYPKLSLLRAPWRDRVNLRGLSELVVSATD